MLDALPWELVTEDVIPEEEQVSQPFTLPLDIEAVVTRMPVTPGWQVMFLFPTGATESLYVRTREEAAAAVEGSGITAWYIANFSEAPEEG